MSRLCEQENRKLAVRYLWVHHHTHKQPTQDIHPPSTTTTNTAANQQPQPPTTTTNQATKQASKLTKSSQASLARLRPLRRPCAWLRPLGCIWATSAAASQLASKPASQQASQRQWAAVARQQRRVERQHLSQLTNHDTGQLVHQIQLARR